MAEACKSDLSEVEKADKSFEDEHVIAPTADEQAAYVRKLDRRIMPVIFLIYMLSVLVSLSQEQFLCSVQQDKVSPNKLSDRMLRNAGPFKPRQRTPSRP